MQRMWFVFMRCSITANRGGLRTRGRWGTWGCAWGGKDQMRSGKVGEEDPEVLLNQKAAKAGGEWRERGQSKGEWRIDVQTHGWESETHQGMAEPGSKARDKIEKAWDGVDGRDWENPGHGIYSFAAAGTSKKEQSYVEGWARQERDREVQIVCTFAEQDVEDGDQVLAISWHWFHWLGEGEEAVMGRGGSKKVTFDGVK